LKFESLKNEFEKNLKRKRKTFSLFPLLSPQPAQSFFQPVLTVKIRQPSHEFTFGVGMTFVSYSLILTPVV
jgi:hypothetical protein